MVISESNVNQFRLSVLIKSVSKGYLHKNMCVSGNAFKSLERVEI